MNWLYLLSGAFALYSVETADVNEPLHITALTALLLCILPVSIESLRASGKVGVNRWLKKAAVEKSGLS